MFSLRVLFSSRTLRTPFWVIAIPLFLLSFSLFARSAKAADRYWVGERNSLSDVWEDTENWSALPEGDSGATVPGASDLAIFSVSGGTIRIRSDVSIAGLLLANTFTGSVLQGTGGLTIGTSSFRVGSGTFVGSSSPITSSGSFSQTGGIVRAVHGTYTQSGSFTVTNGGGSGIPAPSFTSTGTFVLGGDAQSIDAHPQFASITNLSLSGSSRTTLRGYVNVSTTGNLQISTGATLTLNGFRLGATGSTITNYATITEGTGAIAHTPDAFIIADSSYVEVGSVTAGNTIYFSLTESDENVSGTAADTVSITATTTQGESETITLTETSNTSGVFRGSIASADVTGGSVTVGNGTVQAGGSTLTLTATFTDAEDGGSTTDTAQITTTGSSSATSTSSDSGGGGGGGGGRTTAAIKRGELPWSGVSRTGTKVAAQDQPKPPAEPVEAPKKLQERTCGRVAKRFGGTKKKMLEKINARLLKRFGFSCSY